MSSSSVAVTSGLCCPRCLEGPLETASQTATTATQATPSDVLRCPRCDRQYPVVGGIPCLLPDTALWRALWLSRLTEFLADAETSLAGWRAEAEASQALPRTHARIARVIAASEDQRARVDALFADLKKGDPQLLPTRPLSDRDNPVLAFAENIFRDWAWGHNETESMRALVAPLLPASPGRLAAYGVGAGRLALEIHQSAGPTETWALDMNPLPLLVAQKLILGETVTLPEFPVAPHSAEDVAVSHDLRYSGQVRPGFSFLFADALRPPFAPASIDTVLTSWFIDATGRDVRETAAAINRVLRPGGVWINVGPLRFKQSLATTYSIEEIWDIVSASSFELLQRGRDDLPYFDSPTSGSRRIETVFSFAARKAGEAAPVDAAEEAVAPWIADPVLSIPLSPQLIAIGRKSMFAGSVIGLIDGSRSLSQLADEMARLWGFDAARMMDQLRAFFATLPLE